MASHILDMSLLEGPAVYILPGEETEFICVHQRLMSHFSRPFKQQIEDNEERSYMWLQRTSGKVFRLLFKWLYTGFIWNKDAGEECPTTNTLIKLYTFAEESEIPSLQDAAMISLLKTGQTDIETCKSAARYAFKHTCPGSPLRKFIIDVLVWNDDNSNYDKFKSSLTLNICIEIIGGLQKRLSGAAESPLNNIKNYLIFGGNEPEQPKNAHALRLTGEYRENNQREAESTKIAKGDDEVAQTQESYENMINVRNEGPLGFFERDLAKIGEGDIRASKEGMVKAAEEINTKGSEENIEELEEDIKGSEEDTKESEENIAEVAGVDIIKSEAAEIAEVDTGTSEVGILSAAEAVCTEVFKGDSTKEIVGDIEMSGNDIAEVVIKNTRSSEKGTIEEIGTKVSNEDFDKEIILEGTEVFEEGTTEVAEAGTKVPKENDTEEIKSDTKALEEYTSGVLIEGTKAFGDSIIKGAKEADIKVPIEKAKEVGFRVTNEGDIKEIKDDITVPEQDIEVDMEDIGTADNNTAEEAKESAGNIEGWENTPFLGFDYPYTEDPAPGLLYNTGFYDFERMLDEDPEYAIGSAWGQEIEDAAREAESVTKDSNATKEAGDIPKASKEEKTEEGYPKEDNDQNKLFQESNEGNAWGNMAGAIGSDKKPVTDNGAVEDNKMAVVDNDTVDNDKGEMVDSGAVEGAENSSGRQVDVGGRKILKPKGARARKGPIVEDDESDDESDYDEEEFEDVLRRALEEGAEEEEEAKETEARAREMMEKLNAMDAENKQGMWETEKTILKAEGDEAHIIPYAARFNPDNTPGYTTIVQNTFTRPPTWNTAIFAGVFGPAVPPSQPPS